MHKRLYNEFICDLTLRPQTPLLIKAGRSGEDAIDPTLPDMSFVRTNRPDRGGPEVYIPGSSLRGVVRAHAEKLLRSIRDELACDPTSTGGGGETRRACFAGISNTEAIDGPQAYTDSCYACRVFGNTALAGRLRVGDLYVETAREPLLERRYGVAIDRITNAVAQGPFEIEILTDALFRGRITLRNFTLGQIGLLAAALLDLDDGLVPMGYGKSRGLGRVSLTFDCVTVRTLTDPNGQVVGVGALATAAERNRYNLPSPDQERLAIDAEAHRRRGFHALETSGDAAVAWLERVTGRWPQEVGA